jgi:hypothetical protein
MKYNIFKPISTILVVRIFVNWNFLSLHRNLVVLSLSSHKKELKMREINFDIKIKFMKTEGIGLITYKLKKMGDQNKLFKWNLKPPPILHVIFNLILWLLIQPFLKNICNRMLIWVQKNSIVQKKKVRVSNQKLKKKHYFNLLWLARESEQEKKML